MCCSCATYVLLRCLCCLPPMCHACVTHVVLMFYLWHMAAATIDHGDGKHTSAARLHTADTEPTCAELPRPHVHRALIHTRLNQNALALAGVFIVVAGVGSNLIIMIIMIMVMIMMMIMTTNATTHHQGATRGKGRQRAGRSQRAPVKTRAGGGSGGRAYG